MTTGGLGQPFWHIHHEALLEFATHPIENRIAYIREDKPAREIETRLRLLAPVKGKLPVAVVDAGRAYVDAYRTKSEAWLALDDARRAYYDALDANRAEIETRLRLLAPVKGKLPDAVVDAWRAYVDARRALNNARRALDNAWRAYFDALDANRAEIYALHAEECPNCPWNGCTIFPGKEW